MILARDSVNAAAIPANTPVVMGYGDGDFEWSSGDWARFHPPTVLLSIVTRAGSVGDILDVELGDATPAEAPAWLETFDRPGPRCGTLYCNRGNWPQLVAALLAAGIDPQGPVVDWWVSTLDGTLDVRVPAGAKPPVAIQWKGADRTGAEYDETLILDESWVGPHQERDQRWPLPPAGARGMRITG